MKNEKCLKTTSKKALHRFAALAAVLLAFCLVFMMPVSAAWTADTGWGTDYDTSTVFTIANAGELAQFAEMVNDGKTFKGKTIKLTADIDLENQEWTPIANWTEISNMGFIPQKVFSGTFDGNNNTISELKINCDDRILVGLFAALSDVGTVKNLHVSGNISVSSSLSSGIQAGGIVGANQGEISGCSFTGSISVITNSANLAAQAGSIVGSNAGTVSECYSFGTVSADTTGEYKQGKAGGIAGETGACAKIEKCYALNEEVTGNYATARIAVSGDGGIPEFSDNFGWAGMKVNDKVVTDGTASNANGEAIYAWTFWNNPDTTLQTKAAYLEPKFTLTYNVDDNTNAISSTYSMYASGEPEKVASEDGLTKTGYTFAEWNTQGDGNGDAPEEDYIIIEQATTLYAQWTPITYKVVFNPNGGDGSMAEQTFTYGVSQVLSENKFTKTGYTFNGWKNGDATYTDEQSVSDLSSVANNVVTLYANWTANTYTVKFDANGGTGDAMSDQIFTYDEPKKLTKNTYTNSDTALSFGGWNTQADGTGTSYPDEYTAINLAESGEVTLYANWTATPKETVTVTIKSEDRDGLIQNVFKGEKVQNPGYTRTGYELKGWTKDGADWTFDTPVTESITVTAVWEPVEYTITFDSNGGSNVDAITAGYDTPVTAPTAPTKEGYSFAGWTPALPEKMPLGGAAVTAQWTINQYTITFDTQGGSTIDSITADYGTTVNRPTNPTKEGYGFGGWNPDWHSSVATKTITEDVTYTAKWNGNFYKVEFKANGGTGTMADQQFQYGTPQVLTENNFTAPAGKVFNGWNTKADGSGKAYSDKATVSDLTAQSGGYVTLYAQWKSTSSGGSHSTTKTTYTVTFNANGGVGEMFPQTFTSGKEKALNFNFFTKEGYTFAGWATSADGDVVYTDGETIKVSKSMTLYAVWESNEPVNPEQPGDEPEQPGDEPENPEKPTEPETPAPILAVLAGLGAAVVLRRK